jgi:hypothetical protein
MMSSEGSALKTQKDFIETKRLSSELKLYLSY